jgi:hypothetical protein
MARGLPQGAAEGAVTAGAEEVFKRTVNKSAAARRFAGFCLAITLVSTGFRLAPAQCSQAQATPAGAASSEEGHSAAAGDVSSSSAESAQPVRFVTGNAITVLENTPLQVMNDMPISSRTTREGSKLSFTITRDVVVEGVLVIPCGARVYGTVVTAKQAGRLAGASRLTLQLTALDLDGRSYPLYTPPLKVVGQSKTRPMINRVAAGAAVGAVAMDARTAQLNPHLTKPVTGGERAVADTVAAGVGAGVGAAIAASSPPSIAVIPAESQIEFTLASPIAVYPVDQRTAVRLAQGMRRGGPVLYFRGESQ